MGDEMRGCLNSNNNICDNDSECGCSSKLLFFILIFVILIIGR